MKPIKKKIKKKITTKELESKLNWFLHNLVSKIARGVLFDAFEIKITHDRIDDLFKP